MTRALALFLSTSLAASSPADEFFAAEVEPILRTRCYECHSHASGEMRGGLTLDSRAGWQTGGDSGPAIVPGQPGASLLLTAVRYADPDYEMPPDGKLAEAEIAVLSDWVERGAPDPRESRLPDEADTDWWSLRPLVAPAIPGDPGDHPIDAFVRARWGEAAPGPSPPAGRATLARRLHLDLHGLQPTPEALATFTADPDPRAYDRMVDRLLASPRYGERWARHWLDVIHFADSHGCEHDVKRPNAWRYRDYVIDRLNADVPWARFIREQLAPDAFFPDEPQLAAGLGFIAAGPLELSRAGTAPVTFDYLDRDDIVAQTMAALVSTTANCARCHTHKFDPISQDDYYALQAVFAGVGKGDIEFDTSAEIKRERERAEALRAAVSARDASVLLQPKYAPVVARWVEARRGQPAGWTPLHLDTFVSSGGATLTRQGDGSVFAEGTVADQEVYTVTADAPEIESITALRVEALRDDRLPMGGPGRADNGNFHLAEVDLQWFPSGADSPAKLAIAAASADFDQEGWTSAQAIDGDLQTGWAIFPDIDRSHHIVFALAAPVEVAGGGKLVVALKQLHPPKHLIGRFRLSVTDADPAAARALPDDAAEGLLRPADRRTAEQALAVAAAALGDHARERLASLPPKAVVYGASPSWSHAKKLSAPAAPKTVHVLRRGEIDKPMREASPGALSAIGALPGRFELADPGDEAARRAALADWIAHRDNPLTWRSIVNRVWGFHFGRGLCHTPNDFGRMGAAPTHPELLDWLAVWFRDEAGGSLKALHRLILTSETWQRSSRPSAAATHLLAHRQRRRIDAETYRDSVLAMSGRLDLTMGGEGIEQFVKTKGPQATPALDYGAYDWASPGSHRRSIYRVVWRGIPDPFMEAMDFPDLGLLAPERGTSVSSLQALAMFNNDFVLHGSEWLARRAESEGPGLRRRVERAVQLVWLRAPTAAEAAEFESYAHTHGLAALCRVLLNSNEFLFVE